MLITGIIIPKVNETYCANILCASPLHVRLKESPVLTEQLVETNRWNIGQEKNVMQKLNSFYRKQRKNILDHLILVGYLFPMIINEKGHGICGRIMRVTWNNMDNL